MKMLSHQAHNMGSHHHRQHRAVQLRVLAPEPGSGQQAVAKAYGSHWCRRETRVPTRGRHRHGRRDKMANGRGRAEGAGAGALRSPLTSTRRPGDAYGG